MHGALCAPEPPLPNVTEERVTSVECVQCGTRNEVASEAATGMQNGSSATACSACGASLDTTPQKDAPLNEIFSDFERTFHPTVNLGHPSE